MIDDGASRLVDHDRVWRDRPRDHRLAESDSCVDEELTRITGDGMAREDDRRGTSGDEYLDDDGHGVAIERETVTCAVPDRALAPEGRPAAEDRRRDVVGGHPQLGVVQA